MDFFCNPAFEVSKSLNIPTYFYVTTGGLGLCAFLYFPTIHETIPQDIGELNDVLTIPGCPPIPSKDFPQPVHYRQSNIYKHFLSTARNMRKSDGILVNSFDALELRSKEALSNGLCVLDGPTPPTFFISPLLSDSNPKNDVVEHECLKWLDSQPSKSVIFLCFGRRGLFSVQQLTEMAIGLENSGHRFLWSVRNPPGKDMNEDPDLDKLLPKGFLERTKDRVFVVKSWAPQKEVLSHDSVAGFVTHCGRSSILEALWFGVPMIAFPMYAEQRMNRVCMVEEMKVALPLDEAEEGLVTAAELEKRVRVKKGGSSVVALENFIESLT